MSLWHSSSLALDAHYLCWRKAALAGISETSNLWSIAIGRPRCCFCFAFGHWHTLPSKQLSQSTDMG